MGKDLYRKLSSVVLRKLSRALSFNDEDYSAAEFSSVEEEKPKISILHDGMLLKIFKYLSIPDLVKISRVCKKWHRLSFDRFLWKTVDLCHLANTLTDRSALQHVTKSYLAHNVITLNISGFAVPQSMLNTLATSCPELTKLVLKSVTFSIGEEDVLFPGELEYLDVRYSHGNKAVYRAMARKMSKVKWLGLCDAFILALSNEKDSLETISRLENLEKLDFTHCRLAKDVFVKRFGACEKIKVLSLRKCMNICGECLPELVMRLPRLETLILDGTSVDDDCLNAVDWTNTRIKFLEIGWCPFITSKGLNSLLPKIAKMSHLEYLGLCRVGEGQTLNDENLKTFSEQLEQGTCPNLHSLNLSFSDRITDEGIASFRIMNPIETLDVTNCALVTEIEDDDDVFGPVSERKQSAVSFHEPNNNSTGSTSDDSQKVRKRSRGSFSTTQFALSNYTLETPL